MKTNPAVLAIFFLLGGIIGFIAGQQVERRQNPLNRALREAMNPRSETRRRAQVASVKSMLRNVVNAEVGYREDHSSYTTDHAEMNYVIAPGISVVVLEAGSDGFVARGTHEDGNFTCLIFLGPKARYGELVATELEGMPVCADN